MKKATLIIVALLLAQLGGAGDHDTQFLIEQFEKSTGEFTSEIRGLTEAQWRFKPGPESWSIAECAQHIVLTEAFLRQALTEKVLASPTAAAEQLEKAEGADEKVMALIVDRSFTAKAPEPVQPVEVRGSPEDLERSFLEARGDTTKMLQSRAADLRRHVAASPVGEDWDGTLPRARWGRTGTATSGLYSYRVILNATCCRCARLRATLISRSSVQATGARS